MHHNYGRTASDTVGMEIIPESTPDRSSREYQHHGDVFVEAVHGESYKIRLVNKSGGRVLAVLSVDDAGEAEITPHKEDRAAE